MWILRMFWSKGCRLPFDIRLGGLRDGGNRWAVTMKLTSLGNANWLIQTTNYSYLRRPYGKKQQ
jgi:hypothetical protein